MPRHTGAETEDGIGTGSGHWETGRIRCFAVTNKTTTNYIAEL